MPSGIPPDQSLKVAKVVQGLLWKQGFITDFIAWMLEGKFFGVCLKEMYI